MTMVKMAVNGQNGKLGWSRAPVVDTSTVCMEALSGSIVTTSCIGKLQLNRDIWALQLFNRRQIHVHNYR